MTARSCKGTDHPPRKPTPAKAGAQLRNKRRQAQRPSPPPPHPPPRRGTTPGKGPPPSARPREPRHPGPAPGSKVPQTHRRKVRAPPDCRNKPGTTAIVRERRSPTRKPHPGEGRGPVTEQMAAGAAAITTAFPTGPRPPPGHNTWQGTAPLRSPQKTTSSRPPRRDPRFRKRTAGKSAPPLTAGTSPARLRSCESADHQPADRSPAKAGVQSRNKRRQAQRPSPPPSQLGPGLRRGKTPEGPRSPDCRNNPGMTARSRKGTDQRPP
jgi:hypothetical protein